MLAIVTKSGTLGSTAVEKIAFAIARQEGFFKSGSVAMRAKNPGNMKVGDRGLGTINGITVFANAEEGWMRLRIQVASMLSGTSVNYKPWFTIRDVSKVWTATEQAEWAQNVARFIGVSPDTQVKDIA